jgi:hypothetical protein
MSTRCLCSLTPPSETVVIGGGSPPPFRCSFFSIAVESFRRWKEETFAEQQSFDDQSCTPEPCFFPSLFESLVSTFFRCVPLFDAGWAVGDLFASITSPGHPRHMRRGVSSTPHKKSSLPFFGLFTREQNTASSAEGSAGSGPGGGDEADATVQRERSDSDSSNNQKPQSPANGAGGVNGRGSVSGQSQSGGAAGGSNNAEERPILECSDMEIEHYYDIPRALTASDVSQFQRLIDSAAASAAAAAAAASSDPSSASASANRSGGLDSKTDIGSGERDYKQERENEPGSDHFSPAARPRRGSTGSAGGAGAEREPLLVLGEDEPKQWMRIKFQKSAEWAYGPWFDNQRALIMSYFLPFDYRHQRIFKPVVGAPRPHRNFFIHLAFASPSSFRLPYKEVYKLSMQTPPPADDKKRMCGALGSDRCLLHCAIGGDSLSCVVR